MPPPTPIPTAATAHPDTDRPTRAHLDRAHYEIRTALTIVRSNVELVRRALRTPADDDTRVALHAHLSELDLAIDRLLRLASEIRAWHDADEEKLPTPPGADAPG